MPDHGPCNVPGCSLCGVDPAEAEDHMIERFTTAIRRHGWASTGVFDPDNRIISYNYTVGFRPGTELIIVGLPYDVAHSILRAAVEKPVEKPGEYDNVVQDWKVIARRVTSDHPFLKPNWAFTWRRRTLQLDGFDLLQLLWPDKNGVYPTDMLRYQSVPQTVLPRPL